MGFLSSFDLVSFIKTVGYFGILVVVFSESGLLVGFFLPGDSLLFTAGFLASQGYFDLKILVLLAIVGAIVGDSVGYSFGKKAGPRIFTKKDSLFFNKEHIAKSHAFYAKYGGKTIVIARFMPVVRTFVPILAGVGDMSYRLFLFYNVIGGVVWVCSLSFLGYYLGSRIPNIDHYLLPIVIAIIIISALPTLYAILHDPHQRQKIRDYFK